MVFNDSWNEAEKKGKKLDYHFTKENYRVPNDVRQNMTEMTQLKNIARIEIRPKGDECAVSFEVAKNKELAKDLVNRLCYMIEVWRSHKDIVVTAVPQKLYFNSKNRER